MFTAALAMTAKASEATTTALPRWVKEQTVVLLKRKALGGGNDKAQRGLECILRNKGSQLAARCGMPALDVLEKANSGDSKKLCGCQGCRGGGAGDKTGHRGLWGQRSYAEGPCGGGHMSLRICQHPENEQHRG